MNQTETKILDTAERLFGEQGYAATSLRHIISEAGVNLAAIHYHFGSKEELLDQLIARKASPINEERIALLDRLEAEAPPEGPTVEQILKAFLEPPLRRRQHDPNFVKLMGRMYGEGMMPMIADRHFHPTGLRFFAALDRALPHLAKDDLMLRVQFVVGAMAHSMFTGPVPKEIRPRMPVDPVTLTRELVTFLAAGLRAPALIPVPADETSR